MASVDKDEMASGNSIPENPVKAFLIEEVLERSNLILALKRVKENGGAPGLDGVRVEELTPYLQILWAKIKQALILGFYRPQPVRRVEIPKPELLGCYFDSLGLPRLYTKR